MRRQSSLIVLASLLALPRIGEGQSAAATIQLTRPSAPPVTRTTVVRDTRAGDVVEFMMRPLTAAADTASEPDTPEQVSSSNPYVGAQAAYVFGGGRFASNLVANGSVAYKVLSKSIVDSAKHERFRFFVPVRGNMASLIAAKDDTSREKKAQSLISEAQGLRVSVEPTLDLPPLEFLRSSIVTSVGWKLNAVKADDDSTVYLALGRLSAGLSFAIGPTAKGTTTMPIVVELVPTFSSFATRDYQRVTGLEKSFWSGDLTVIVPVGSGMGFLTEATVAQRALPTWRTGLVLTAQTP